jgi:hypothetical protein
LIDRTKAALPARQPTARQSGFGLAPCGASITPL